MIAANTIIGGRYRVTRPLGGGGMKQVYLAEDLRLAARACALAEMVDSFTNPEMQKAAVGGFQREADMLAELSHEHIPRIYDRFSDQNRHYLVMEFVDGETLEEKIKEAGGKLSEREVIDVSLQILDTLDYLHQLNPAVVYRDLKPSNVMITTTGQLKLIDFGIARHFQPQSNATMIGTQGYAPPEQYRGKVETRSDLYALGATMHHALSGRDPTAEPPFSFPPLKSLCPTINPALADLVNDALAYDVALRVATAADFKRRLLSIKIENLTQGLVDQADVAAVLKPSAQSGKPQLHLPLKTPAASAPPSPSAPTVLTASPDIECPSCTKLIPADSRFCSYCAFDLRRRLSPAQVMSHESETVHLEEPSAIPVRLPTQMRGERNWVRRHRSRMRFPGLLILFLGAFAAVRMARLLSSLVPTSIPGDSSAPSEYSPPPPAASGDSDALGGPSATEPEHHSAPSAMLRRTLDEMGYKNVHFKVTGRNVALWGSVPSETDRLMVETTVFTVTGAVSLDDHIQLQENLAEP